MPFNWGESKPGDSDIVSQFPADERATRATVRDAFNYEHDADTGRHKLPMGTTAQRDALTNWVQGAEWLNTDSSPTVLQVQKNSAAPFAWDSIGGFPAGTKMCFFQASAPPGWTQDTSLNDRFIRVVGTGGAGGSTGGSHILTGLTTSSSNTGGYALTSSDLPIGANELQAQNGGSGVGSVRPDKVASAHAHGIPVLTVVSDGVWRPAYLDCIIAVKN